MNKELKINALHYLTLCIFVDFPETWAGVDDPVAEAARGGGSGAGMVVSLFPLHKRIFLG